MLLLHPGRIVGLGELTEALWGADPPITARGQLQTCVSRLRRLLPDGAILTDRAGYGIRVGPDDLDALVFVRLADEARAAGDAAGLRAALGLWRGTACPEIDALAVRQAADALDERRALAVEDWADLELAAGRARDLLGELGELVQRYPLRERLRGQLMTALHRSGRQADALAEYRRARDTLVAELGIEPGPELQELHRKMLSGDVPAVSSASIRCLPRTVGDFTGRGELVDRLLGDAPSGAAVVVIDGMAGSGKTTLALHVAARLGDRYPDAHLFVDLRGHSEQPPVEPSAALIVLLRQLGVAAENIPSEPVERIGLWRTEMASRRALVVLDNAASSAQIADLLPTAPGSLALVTARRRLAGLDGARVESVPMLAPDDALTLLERIAGPRVRDEPQAAAEVVRRCGGLPLAVRLAGARLAHRPRWRVADLLHRLGETALPELAAEERTVAGAFTLTYRQLPESLQRVFRLLGVHPGGSFDSLAVAALTGSTPVGAGDALDDLVDVHLVEEPEPGVFRMHDLLRQYAGMLAAELTADQRRAALTCLLDFQLHAFAAATSPSHQEGMFRDLRWPVAERADLSAAVADPGGRIERERPNLTAYVDAAAAAGLHDYAWKIARAAWQPLFFRGYMDDIRDLHLRAMTSAEHLGDRSAIATVANYLASAYGRAGEDAAAERYLLLAIRLRTELGEMGPVATATGNLGSIYQAQGRFAESLAAMNTCRRAETRGRWRANPSVVLSTLAEVHLTVGNVEKALYFTRIRLLGVLDKGEPGPIAGSLLLIARIRYQQGVLPAERAHRYIDVAMRLAARVGYRSMVADCHNDRAALFRDEGRYAEAVVEHRQALAIMSTVHDLRHEVEYVNDYATTLLRSGDTGAARERFQSSLTRARAGGLRYTVARALAGLAECVADTDPEQARRLRAEARELFERMGVPVPERLEPAHV
ncbi:BTAD domain-containing putative transcriptional regulator [Actinoplanes sp. NPDC051861]|uniref:AfsR/SARP family transcriptional regulator n=1 Tax=Actinoplanes sp. NPDC051861 TaxID=3155170 RepID=UPI003436D1D1